MQGHAWLPAGCLSTGWGRACRRRMPSLNLHHFGRPGTSSPLPCHPRRGACCDKLSACCIVTLLSFLASFSCFSVVCQLSGGFCRPCCELCCVLGRSLTWSAFTRSCSLVACTGCLQKLRLLSAVKSKALAGLTPVSALHCCGCTIPTVRQFCL